MGISDVKAGPRNEDGIKAVTGILKQRFGEAFTDGESLRQQHMHTVTYLPGQPPDAVVFPTSQDEVRDLVRICADHKVPVIPFGAGTSLEGHLNAPRGGISVDTSRMNRILRVSQEDLDCTVEPGVTREDLNTHLRDTGLFFPIDPGANASLGGMTATRASGTNAVRYGTMRDNVLSITAVMADGQIIHTGSRARKSSAGYDLTGLFVGSEGTLGVITDITLRLFGVPEAILAGVCPFPSVDDAVNAVIQTIQMGIPVARIELLDKESIIAVNEYSGLDYPHTPVLFLEFHGSPAYVREQSEMFREIAEGFGASALEVATAQEDRNRLWKARHDAYWALSAIRPGLQGLSTDVCVPVSQLADCIRETQRDASESGFLAPTIGHVGDGNFHCLVFFDPRQPEELQAVEAFIERLNRRAVAMGGTCTGEHGIGQGKQQALWEEKGPSIDSMRAIKQALDPDNIMNPGKIF